MSLMPETKSQSHIDCSVTSPNLFSTRYTATNHPLVHIMTGDVCHMSVERRYPFLVSIHTPGHHAHLHGLLKLWVS